MEITWRFISGEGEGKMGEGKVQGVIGIIGRHKIDRRVLEQYRKYRSQRTYRYIPWT